MFQQVGILFNTCDKIDFKLSMKSNFTGSSKASIWPLLAKGPFKYYVSKEVGGPGQKMSIADLQNYLC